MQTLEWPTPGLTFQEEGHRYELDGRRVMNVTRALGLITDYRHVEPGLLARAQDEGIAMHRMVALYLRGVLDLPSLPDWLKPRLQAFQRFQGETGFVPYASEQRVYSKTYDYAGTLDLAGYLRTGRGTTKAVIDIKRTLYYPLAIGSQTAAYLKAWNERCQMTLFDRFGLQLRADGTYRLEPYTSPSDFTNFLACLTVARLRETMHAPA